MKETMKALALALGTIGSVVWLTAGVAQTRPCEGSLYEPPLAHIRFGMSKEETKRVLPKEYPQAMASDKDENTIRLDFPKSDTSQPWGMIVFTYQQDRLVLVAYSYGVGFVEEMGGGHEAGKAVLDKHMLMFGKPLGMEEEGKGHKVTWPTHGGARMIIFGQLPNTLITIFQCKANG